MIGHSFNCKSHDHITIPINRTSSKKNFSTLFYMLAQTASDRRLTIAICAISHKLHFFDSLWICCIQHVLQYYTTTPQQSKIYSKFTTSCMTRVHVKSKAILTLPAHKRFLYSSIWNPKFWNARFFPVLFPGKCLSA